MSKYFDIYIENPLKTYNKIKKYFKPIKPKFQIYFGLLNSAKIIKLNVFDLMWKDKGNSPRHEFNPRLIFSLFNIIHIYIEWIPKQDSMASMVYWESALNWLYYDKDLTKAVELSSCWSEYNKNTDSYELMRFEILKPEYQLLYNNNILPKIMYEGNKKN